MYPFSPSLPRVLSRGGWKEGGGVLSLLFPPSEIDPDAEQAGSTSDKSQWSVEVSISSSLLPARARDFFDVAEKVDAGDANVHRARFFR